MDLGLNQLDGIPLEELDERAALRHRVDNKYLVKEQAFKRLVDEVATDHDVLDIDGRRRFGYESVYFDTPDLRCFHDHAEGRRPRFKARTRYYRDSGICNFEVKIKTAADETDKRQIDYTVADREQLTESAEHCLSEALQDSELDPATALRPTLRTAFERATLAAREAASRLTCDFGVRLERFGGGERNLRRGLVLVETKSESGESAADRVLSSMGLEPTGLSKYRVGVAMLSDETIGSPPSGNERFFA